MKLFNPDLILEDGIIRLSPSTLDDINELNKIVDPDIWKHISIKVTNRNELEQHLQQAVSDREQALRMQFTMR